MRRATCVVVLMLGACAHVDRELEQGDTPQRCRVTVVLCLFATCHHIGPPDGAHQDERD